MNTVTVAQLDEVFRGAIAEIVPTHENFRAAGWAYVAAQHLADGTAELPRALRNYTLIWRVTVPTYLWVGGTGTAYQAELHVATSYADVTAGERELMIPGDAVDLYRALHRLVSGALGLARVKPLRPGATRGDTQNFYFEHLFEVHWHQDTV